ncbi:hypothetical protein J4Q44_G00306180 [Coregonus suidteri]|uniref:Uncharacterized protein n=1 Tax=Coregonus suidteri TaxID=861788 RepID=A0AAN8KVZ2_9TELE
MRTLVNNFASRIKNFGMVAAVVPFIGFLINAVQKEINDPGDKAAIDLAKTKMSQLQEEKNRSVPDPVHLSEVQQSLSKIQAILLQLKGFWENIRVMVTNLQQSTFAGEDLIVLWVVDHS